MMLVEMMTHKIQYNYEPLKTFCMSLCFVASSNSKDTEFRLADDSEPSVLFV